jgi:hypothetical protein
MLAKANMRRLGTVGAIVGLLATAGAQAAVRVRLPNEPRPDGGAVAASLDSFQRGFKMCSRPGPKGATSYWELSPAEVGEIDRALLDYLSKGPVTKTLAFNPAKYVRQYAGFRRGRRQFVYMNAYPSRHLPGPANPAARELAIGCDGGDMFWGIEYDQQKRKFQDLEVNGLPPEPARVKDAPRAKEIVLVGTVRDVVPNDHEHQVLEGWTVTVAVDRVVSGGFSGPTFTFDIHSPGRAGLRIGKSCTIKARWTDNRYVAIEPHPPCP